LAGVPTPVIDAHIVLASAATGRDYRAEGLTRARMGLADLTPGQVRRLAEEGSP